jgi:integrase
VSYYRLRISECLALKWSDLDCLKGTLKIERSIVEQHLDDVKTEDSRRSLTVASDLMQRLQSWKTVTMFGRDSD